MSLSDNPPELTPLDHAAAALAALIARGPAPERVTEAIGTLVASWANEPDMSEDVMLDRVGQLWDQLSKDAADLQERLSDAEGEGTAALAEGRRVLAALDAAVSTLAAVSAR